MKSETSLLHFSQRFATVSLLNCTCSLFPERRCPSALPTLMTTQDPCTRSNRQISLLSTYRRHEQEKKRQYDQRIREVEHSTFTPLVLSTTGGMGRAATTFYKRLAAMLSEKRDVPYSKMIGWIRCRLSFSLLRASVISIRGTRSSATQGALRKPIELQVTEGQLQVV